MHASSELDGVLDQSALIIFPIELHLSLLFFDLVLVFDVVIVLDGKYAGINAEHPIFIFRRPSQSIAFRS